ncbi:uncharacterized protein [Diabrotica undecimpunctata]|uniref:uncharacterized protein isoform X1 n=1 Tax=Diabrotica undecimpunctata TaxID=50387 RepID=UPI003B632AD2
MERSNFDTGKYDIAENDSDNNVGYKNGLTTSFTQTNNSYSKLHYITPRKTHIVKDLCTQTSKTLIPETSNFESAPDILSPINRICKSNNPFCTIDYVKHTTKEREELHNGLCHEGENRNINVRDESYVSPRTLASLPFDRSFNVVNFFKQGQPQQKALLSGTVLTRTYLEKNKNKLKKQHNLEMEPSLGIRPANMLKSQSYVEKPYFCKIHKQPQRFYENSEVFENKNNKSPKNYFLKVSEVTQTEGKAKTYSFMSPTIASERKNQSLHIKTIERLISPTRLGRSITVKNNKTSRSRDSSYVHVPVIDKHKESVQVSGAKLLKQQHTTLKNNFIQRHISPSRRGRSISPNHNKLTRVRDCSYSHAPLRDKTKANIRVPAPKLQRQPLDASQNEKNSYQDLSFKGECSTSSISDLNLVHALCKLRDPDWNISLRGLGEIIELCKVIEIESIYPHMTMINQRLVDLIKSSRSHVSRYSCQALGHLFEYAKDTRRPEFCELVDTLLSKCASANKFIRHDANLALDCMVTHIPIFHSVRALCANGPQHKNPLVRTAAARLLVCATVLAVPNILHPQSNEHTRRRIIQTMVSFLEDKHAEVRKYGERLYKMLSEERIFDLYLNKYLEKDVVNKMKKIIKVGKI